MKKVFFSLLVMGMGLSAAYAVQEEVTNEKTLTENLEKLAKSSAPGSAKFCQYLCTAYTCGEGSIKAVEMAKKIGLTKIVSLKQTSWASICKSEKSWGCTEMIKVGGQRFTRIGAYNIRKRFGEGYSLEACVRSSNAIKEKEGKGPTVEGIMKRKSPAVYSQQQLEEVRDYVIKSEVAKGEAKKGYTDKIKEFVTKHLDVQ